MPCNVLVDSGATDNFIDFSLANTRPDLLCPLDVPLSLELFDGNLTSSGNVTHELRTPLIFDNGVSRVVRFLVTQLHPSAPVVLGLPWLRDENPVIDWPSLTLSLAAPDTHKLEGTDSGTSSPKSYIPEYSQSTPGSRAKNAESRTLPDSTSTAPPTPQIRLISARTFADAILTGEEAYHMYVAPASNLQGSRATPIPSNPIPTYSEEHLLHKHVPTHYHQYADVFSENVAKEIPPHRPYDHKIDLLDGTTPPHSHIYNMSELELKALKDYLDDMTQKGFIRPSSSPAGAPVLFVKKKDGSLRLCVDYRGLNRITKRNRYPIPLIGTLIDRLSTAKIYSKIDLRVGYNNVCIAEGHEWKTAFRTRYGSFEYLVMPFGMTNAPATFQYFMNDIFRDMTDIFIVIYLDDILIYSENEKDHQEHVRRVLERLRQHNLHARPDKCSFHTKEVEYLGVIVSPAGIAMDPTKVQTILDWPAPRKVRDVQSFLGFANFYRRFIDNFSGIVRPITRLLSKSTVWKWSPECQSVFELLKTVFTTAPILRHYNPEHPVILECDASDFAIAAILSQTDSTTKEIHPIAFHARTMLPAELNYDIYDKELLAIFEAFKQWRAYLEGVPHQIMVYSDHNNLQYFTTTKQLSRRQARWSEYLSGFNFTIVYRAGRLGAKPDALTRRPDVYPKKSWKTNVNAFNKQILLPPERLAATYILDHTALLDSVRNAPADHYFRQNATDPIPPFSVSQDKKLLLRQDKIYVPDHAYLRYDVIKAHHDHLLRGHPGIKKTTQIIMRTFFWPGLRKSVTSYVQACPECQRAKSSRHKPYGLLKPLPIADRPWSSLSMDHIEGLPLSEDLDSILVIVCRLTKQAIFIPTHSTDDAPRLAQHFITHVFSKHGLPHDIVSDRGKLFVSNFWTSLCKALHIQSNLSTAYHPETDGQTERINQILEQFLRIYINYLQDNWVSLLPIAEFAYNNTPHSATGVSPFFANKGYHPSLTVTLSDIPSHKAHSAASDLKSLHLYLREQIQVANEAYKRHADTHRNPTPVWKPGTQVWLNAKNIKTKRPMKKLDHKKLGPFTIRDQVSSHAYRLDLPESYSGIHNVFHVSLLEPAHPDPYSTLRNNKPPPVEVEGEEEYEVEEILDSRKRRGKVQYLVRWLGYGPSDDTWQTLDTLEHAIDALQDFHLAYPQKPYDL